VILREGAREETVEMVDFVVTAVMTEVSLSLPASSSEDSGGGGEGFTVLRRRLGEEATGLETGTADAERRVPAVDVRVVRTILEDGMEM
jgi:hypothetical protein